MWAQIKTSKLGPRCIRPSPFQGDVGGVISLDEGIWEGIWEGEKYQGGPKKWEARQVRFETNHDENRGSFSPLSSYLPPTDVSNPTPAIEPPGQRP
jgi:hypothetical protein